jgi:hypothetical protein
MYRVTVKQWSGRNTIRACSLAKDHNVINAALRLPEMQHQEKCSMGEIYKQARQYVVRKKVIMTEKNAAPQK